MIQLFGMLLEIKISAVSNTSKRKNWFF